MMWDKIRRRHFLHGVGQFGLWLPILPSLRAKAAEEDQKNFICFFKPNGCYSEDYFGHDLYKLDQAKDLSGGHRSIRLDQLPGPISEIFPTQWDAVKGQLNFYLGLDAARTNHDGSIPFATGGAHPSVDQLVYEIWRERGQSVHISAVQATTRGYQKESSFALNNGRVQPVRAYNNAIALFKQLFSDVRSAPIGNGEDQFAYLIKEEKAVDAILEDAKSMLKNKNLSDADKRMLGDYLEFVNEKQKKLKEMIRGDKDHSIPQKGVPPIPSKDLEQKPLLLMDEMVELMVAAIKTGACQVFNFQLASSVDETSFPLTTAGYRSGDYHSIISHDSNRREDHKLVDRYLFGQVLKTFQELNAPIHESGSTYADNTLIYVSGDIGTNRVPSHHESNGLIAITLAGKHIPIASGRALAYSKYREQANGYPHNQLLIGLMQALGIPPSDWQALLSRHGLGQEAGFGEYGGSQMGISAGDKEKPLPYLFG